MGAATKAGYREVGGGSSYSYWTRGEPKKYQNLNDALPLATEYSVEPEGNNWRWRLYNKRGEIFNQVRDTQDINVAKTEMERLGKTERQGKPVPPEVLKDYPDLQPKEGAGILRRTTPIRVTPEGKTYYDMDKQLPSMRESLLRAPERPETMQEWQAGRTWEKPLPPKEQKTYAVNAVNQALKGPFEHEGGPSHILIDVPGDGEFHIRNNQYALEQIAKNFKQFPVGKEPQAPKVSGMGGPQPGQRNTLDKIEDLEYFTPEYKPKKSGYLIPAGPERTVYYSEGFYTDGHLMVKMPKAPAKMPKYEKGSLKKIIGDMDKAAKYPAKIEGEYKSPNDQGLGSLVLFKGKEGVVPVKAKYVDYVMENHPEAKPYVLNQDRAVVFKIGKEPVAAVMPVQGEYDYKKFVGETKLYGGMPGWRDVIRILTEPADAHPRGYTEEQKASALAAFSQNAKDTVSNSHGTLRRLWDWYREPHEWTEHKAALHNYLGQREKSFWEVQQMVKDIRKTVPSRTRQDAITNYIEAGGDEATLTTRRDATKNAKLKQGYDEALRLTDDEKLIAKGAVEYFDKMLKEAQEAGVLEGGLENYVTHIWDKIGDKRAARKLIAQTDAGMLRTNFPYARKRIFETYFEGEQLGRVPRDKSIAYLMSAYHQSFYEAIAARKYIKSLLDGTASDGRPLAVVSGMGNPMERPITEAMSFEDVPGEYDTAGEKKGQPYFIRPKAKGTDFGDYQHIDHPALRKWKWLDTDPMGNPLFMQGDIVVHPEIHSKGWDGLEVKPKHKPPFLDNILAKSWLRQKAPTRALLRLGAEGKATLLAAGGPFHQIHLGEHAIFHGVNPYNPAPIDFNDPVQHQGVMHGLMIANHNALSEFAEGLHAIGLVNRLPIIGSATMKYGQYLFTDYLPRLKMAMYKEAFQRNTARYGNKYTADQIAEVTAEQANAAFGHLNYKAMGRNPTMQDAFRLLALAPDFLEARFRFKGQALPGRYGSMFKNEQMMALVKGALGMYGTGVLLNTLFGDEHNPQWNKPFIYVKNGREYTIRSVPGDIIHLLRDWRSFAYHRMNPTVARPIWEYFNGRDAFGRYRDGADVIRDWVVGMVPIPLQGAFNKREEGLLNSALRTIAITSWPARTEIQKELSGHPLGQPVDKDKAEERNRLKNLMRQGKKQEFDSQLNQSKLFTTKEKGYLKKEMQDETAFGLMHKPFEWAFKAWQDAPVPERRKYAPILKKRLENLRHRDPEKYEQFKKYESELRKYGKSEYSIPKDLEWLA